jgi:hypothetical protein
LKKTIKITGITLLVLLAVLFLAPFLFKGKILNLIKKELNETITAKADFEDLSISFFRNFPKVSVALENLYIAEVPGFPGDTLISAKEINVAVDVMSIISGNTITVNSIRVKNPRVKVLVNHEGRGNWDIMKPDTAAVESEEPSAFHMELSKYSVDNGYLFYYDSTLSMKLELDGLNHEGKGDFTATVFTLNTYTDAAKSYFTYGGIPYLSGVKLKANAEVEIDTEQEKYSFSTDDIYLNELQLAVAGYYQFLNDSVSAMDISFSAPKTDFKHLLSLIPAIYAKDFEKIKTGGNAKFEGFVKGEMDDQRMPAFRLNLGVDNAYFQYPDLPAQMKDISLNLLVDNPDGIMDHTVIDLSSGHFRMGNDPFDFRILIKQPLSSIFMDAAARGSVNLGNLSQIVKLDEGTDLKGLLNADVAVKGIVSQMQQQNLSNVDAKGTIKLADFKFKSVDYPDPVVLDELLLTFNPKNITLNNAKGNYLGTSFTANGTLNNLLEYMVRNTPLRGNLNVIADKVDVNKWMGVTTTEGDAEVQEAPADAKPFIVPANLEIGVFAKAGEVKYDDLIISNLEGNLLISDETVKLENVKGNALDGVMAINGLYSTKTDKNKPDIKFSYNVQNVDVQKTFYAFNTVQKLMPLGKWLGGKINSSFVVSGKLGESMMPVVQSLTGEGTLLLIDGFLEKFGPLEKLGEKLKIKELANLTLKDVRQHFEFTNGKVYVKPFTVKHQTIEMEIGGFHGIDQSLDYSINLKIPRSMLGTEANNVINGLVAQASAKGLNIQQGEYVNVHAKMLGNLNNPDIQLDARETGKGITESLQEQAKEFAQQKADSIKTVITDTLQAVKKQLVNEATEKLKEELLKKTDTTKSPVNDLKKDAAEKAKGVLKNVLQKKDSTKN